MNGKKRATQWCLRLSCLAIEKRAAYNFGMNVLFLCTHNSARSILAECLLNHHAQRLGLAFTGFSAGSSPRANQQPHPLGLQALTEAGVSTQGVSSKSWDAFAGAAAPQMDAIITVCDSAAGEVCPIWPGQPASAHWGYADPSAGDASDAQKLAAFRSTLHAIERRVLALLALPRDAIQPSTLRASLQRLSTV
jgi:arsenate reductase (thioredoxin)